MRKLRKCYTISQREARRLKKRVRELEASQDRLRDYWRGDWPGTVLLRLDDPSPQLLATVTTARKLHHAVCVTAINDHLLFWASQLPEVKR